MVGANLLGMPASCIRVFNSGASKDGWNFNIDCVSRALHACGML
jgi:hypothetical protein